MSNKEFCPICGNKVGILNLKINNDIKICKECVSKAYITNGSLRTMTVEDFKNHLTYRENNKKELSSFNTTHEIQISTLPSYFLRIDANKGFWYYAKKDDYTNIPIYKFGEIMSYELQEDGESIVKGGLGRAIAGGLLFGGVGAVIGGVTGKRTTKTIINSMKFIVSINNQYVNHLEMDFLNLIKDLRKDGFLYKSIKETATKVVSLFDFMCKKVKLNIPPQEDVTELILKLKKLLDANAITQQEFDEKKAELLSKYI